MRANQRELLERLKKAITRKHEVLSPEITALLNNSPCSRLGLGVWVKAWILFLQPFHWSQEAMISMPLTD